MKITDDQYNDWRQAALDQGVVDRHGVPKLGTWIKAAATERYANLLQSSPKEKAAERLPEPPRRRSSSRRERPLQEAPEADATAEAVAGSGSLLSGPGPAVRKLAPPCAHVPVGTFCKRCGETRAR